MSILTDGLERMYNSTCSYTAFYLYPKFRIMIAVNYSSHDILNQDLLFVSSAGQDVLQLDPKMVNR